MTIAIEVFQGYPFEFEWRWPRQDIEVWCKENCIGEWNSQLLLGKQYSTWKFTESKDAELFSLRWS